MTCPVCTLPPSDACPWWPVCEPPRASYLAGVSCLWCRTPLPDDDAPVCEACEAAERGVIPDARQAGLWEGVDA